MPLSQRSADHMQMHDRWTAIDDSVYTGEAIVGKNRQEKIHQVIILTLNLTLS